MMLNLNYHVNYMMASPIILQVSKMNKEMLTYLQQDNIGKVIAKGLADVYTNKPQAPVRYLAAWLQKYSANQREISDLAMKQTIKGNSLNALNRNLQAATKQQKEESILQTSLSKKLQDFKKMVANHDYHEQLLDEDLPEFIEKQLNLTGTYIGYLNHPSKDITDQDEDQNAHLNTNIPKLINYIGASNSHKKLMLAKTLPLDKGVTAAALGLSLDDPAPNEDGVVEQKDKYVYIPNVVKNENVHYFRLPKLGAYITVPLSYNSYLTEHIFDVALESRVKYLGELQDFKKSKEDDLKDLDTEKQTLEQKLQELTEKNNDETALEATKAELADNLRRHNEKVEQKFADQSVVLPVEKREYLVCGDTLGLDRVISEHDRELLVELVRHFRDSWESKEKQLLDKDVEYQISIQKHLDRKADTVLEQLESCCQIPADLKTQFDSIEDEQIREYKKSTWQLQALKKQLKEGPEYMATFFKLKNFRVVKFKEVIQAILFFLHMSKREINLAGKTSLNWKKVRATYLYANTFSAVIDYNPEGPKDGEYAPYCKIGHILQTLQKYPEADLFHYNVGLGGLVRLIKKQLAHRQANIELRRQQKENLRKERNLVLEENDKIAEQKRVALDKHKQTLQPEELDSFLQDEWSKKYDEEFPLKEIPPQIVDDIDNDL